jgi:hypothetical protein
MSRLHDFERLIDDKLRGLFRGSAPQGEKLELIEVHRAILDDVASHIESLPRGRRTFSFPNVTVRVLLPDASRRRSYEVAFAEGDALAHDIEARLADERVDLPDRFHVDIELVDELPADIAARGFDISYRGAEVREAAAPVPAVWLKVLSGRAEHDEYSFRRTRINIGRLADVLDSQHKLLRRNDVAFVESAENPNSTVSRTHAHLEFDASAQQFRLYDDRSAQGTSVIREGNILNVPRGVSKGVPLRPGDEIVVGQARLGFDLHSESETQ